jgi:hypothetical protein
LVLCFIWDLNKASGVTLKWSVDVYRTEIRVGLDQCNVTLKLAQIRVLRYHNWRSRFHQYRGEGSLSGSILKPNGIGCTVQRLFSFQKRKMLDTGDDAFRQTERAWFKVAFLFGEWKRNPGCLVPRSVPGSGENPAVKKSQQKYPLIFFYAAPPFSGLALPT